MSRNKIRNSIEAPGRARDTDLFQSSRKEQLLNDLSNLRFKSVPNLFLLRAINQHRADERLMDLGVARQPWRIN